jgi:hypothetical protein
MNGCIEIVSFWVGIRSYHAFFTVFALHFSLKLFEKLKP